jgi:LuxR family transcriptional regulator, maltose regulon positive regulatory protein
MDNTKGEHMSIADSGVTSSKEENDQIMPEQSKRLLQTKFYVPPIRSNQVSRPRLIDLLNGGMDKTITLVSAPAGYGKTTLISKWLKETGISSAWLSLDVGDNDPTRFLQYLITSIQTIAPTIGNDLLYMLQGAQPAQHENVINLLTNELASLSDSFVLVLDDFHVINNETVLSIIYYLLEHVPHHKHLVLLTRIDPPLPLSRLRVRNQLLDIRADQLRFTRDEITAFLNDVMGLTLSANDLSAMETRTEGWIAGLQLAALSMQSSKDIHGFVSAFTGSHHYIMDYLVEEVLKAQPKQVGAFLLQTSILDNMCGPLCEAVIDKVTNGPVNGQEMLEALEKMNLFVIPLDNERRWYRYHRLFADVLRKRLEHQYPQLLAELHHRASRWYEQNGLTFEAIQQAIVANDKDRAAQLIEGNGCFLLMSGGEVATLLNWTDAIEFKSEMHPWLAILKAWALALTGNLDRVEPTLRVPEQLLSPLEPTDEVRTMLGTIAAARAHCANSQGDTRLAAEYAQQALEKLPDCSSICTIRSVATLILGDTSWINGDLDNAAHAYAESIRIGREAGNLPMVIIAKSNFADVLMEQGQLYRAADIYNQTMQMAVRPDGQRSPLAVSIYAGLCRLSYENNRLDDAAQDIHRCIDLCRQWGDLNFQAVACAMLARLEQIRGNPEECQKAMRSAEQLADKHSLSPRQFILVNSDLARLWLAQGNPERLSQHIQKSGLTIEDDIPSQREPEYVILLRALLAQGDYDASLALSKRLLQKAEASKRVGRVIEVLVLQALIFQDRKDLDQALAVLKRAIALARPEKYVRTFIDEGEPMVKLLHLARSRQIETEYVTDLLNAIQQASGTKQPPPQLLSEPLTTREVEVLKLIEAGSSNQEIAEKLVISIATVKRHISNIYTKLDVKTRTQAIAIGKELKLFK